MTIDLRELWAIQEAESADALEHDVEVLVPAASAELGPYARYALLRAGEDPPDGWRRLTPDEVRAASGEDEEDPDRR